MRNPNKLVGEIADKLKLGNLERKRLSINPFYLNIVSLEVER